MPTPVSNRQKQSHPKRIAIQLTGILIPADKSGQPTLYPDFIG